MSNNTENNNLIEKSNTFIKLVDDQLRNGEYKGFAEYVKLFIRTFLTDKNNNCQKLRRILDIAIFYKDALNIADSLKSDEAKEKLLNGYMLFICNQLDINIYEQIYNI